MDEKTKSTLDKTMIELQNEWEINEKIHKMQRGCHNKGIRSSQISALVAYLIKIGVIK